METLNAQMVQKSFAAGAMARLLRIRRVLGWFVGCKLYFKPGELCTEARPDLDTGIANASAKTLVVTIVSITALFPSP